MIHLGMIAEQKSPAVFIMLAAVGLGFAVLFSGVFVIAEHDHNHIDAEGRHVPAGEDCHICLEIQIAQRLIEAMARLGVCFFLAVLIKYAAFYLKAQTFFLVKKPIELKVRFNC
jgi:hypothetical protein